MEYKLFRVRHLSQKLMKLGLRIDDLPPEGMLLLLLLHQDLLQLLVKLFLR